MNRILLVGVARSGTTWVGTVLSKCADTHYINEPDDERRFSAAALAKTTLTRYPCLAPGDGDGPTGMGDARIYSDLWQHVWNTDLAKNLIVKSVFLPFCLEWMVIRYAIDHVVWIRRDLRNVVASWYEYSSVKHPDVAPDVLARRLAWQACFHFASYHRLQKAGLYSAIVDHQTLAHDAETGFTVLAGVLGLEFGHEAMEQLADLNSAGVGGHYGLEGYSLTEHISRTADQISEDAWRDKMPEEQMKIVEAEIERWS